MQPSVTHEGPDLVLNWGNATMRLSKVHEHSDGYTAMFHIGILGVAGLDDGPIFNSTVQLAGSRSKADAARACEKRVPDGFDWLAMIEFAANLVIEQMEAGGEIEDLATGEADMETRYVVPPLLIEQDPTMLYGMGGTGKSLLSMGLSAAIAGGLSEFCGMPAYVGKVLYLDYEGNAASGRRRLQKITTGLGIESRPHVLYQRGEASLPSMAAGLARRITQEKIEVLIVDHAAIACGGDPNAAETANAYFRALRSLRLRASLTVAHRAKADGQYPLGSIGWWNGPRLIWRAIMSGGDDNALHVGLANVKANEDRKAPPIALKILFGESITFQREAASKQTALRPDISTPAQIIAAIQELSVGTFSPSRDEAFAHCHSLNGGIRDDTFRRSLQRLVTAGQVRERNGRLELLTLPLKGSELF